MTDDVRIRNIADGDWDGLAALEAGAYTRLGLSEGRAELESRGVVSPETCFVIRIGERLAGYVLALPYPMHAYPDLNRAEPGRPDEVGHDSLNLHLHDLVIAEDLRRRGLAGRLVRHLTETAGERRYERISLVAVGGSETFWSAQGYRVHPDVAPPVGYGADAVYMSRALSVSGAV